MPSLLVWNCGPTRDSWTSAAATRLWLRDSSPIATKCLGVDFSEYLISVANARFASPRHAFICQEALEYATHEAEPLRFDKVLCFAVFSYLSDASARQLLASLNQRFLNVRSVFVGNIPDPELRCRAFSRIATATQNLTIPNRRSVSGESRAQMVAMAEETGWRVHFQHMPPSFYQAHYRYNAILERPA